MKRTLTLIFPLALLLSVLLTFVVRGGSASAASSSPYLVQASCNAANVTFVVSSDYGAKLDCFTGTGTLAVAIYNVDAVATGNATGHLIWDDGYAHYHQWNFPYKYTDYHPSGVTYLSSVDFIYIS